MSVLEKRLGAVRPTQLIHSFGIGAIIDLPHFSAMLLGLEDWPEGYCGAIAEERLLRAVQQRLGPQVEPDERVRRIRVRGLHGLVRCGEDASHALQLVERRLVLRILRIDEVGIHDPIVVHGRIAVDVCLFRDGSRLCGGAGRLC